MNPGVLRVLASRLMSALPILFLVSVLLFVVLRLIPVDPLAMSLPPNATIEDVEQMRRDMGFDRPIHEQYGIWIAKAVSLDFGRSIHHRDEVSSLIGQTLPQTMELALVAIAIATILGLAGGFYLFHVRGRKPETAVDLGSIVILSLPDFLWGLFLILLCGVAWEILPFNGRLAPEFTRPSVTGFLLLDTLLVGRLDMFVDAVKHMVLPSLALGISFSPAIMRVLRSSLIDVYAEDYIQQARLRGVNEVTILLRHAAKNAILPTLTLMGVQFGFLFGGTLLIEVIFSYPGMGSLMVEAVRNADLPLIQAVGLTYCVAVLLINGVVDALYLALNPRLRTAR